MNWTLLTATAAKGALLLAAAWCIAVLLERRSAATRHWVWLLCMAGLLAIPILPLLAPEETSIVLTAATVSGPPTSSVPQPFAWKSWAVTAWLAVALALAVRVAGAWLYVWWESRKARPLGEGVFECRSIPMPAAFGLLRYRILLPEAAREWPEERRHAVLLHERAHAERLDGLTHLMAQLACCVHWFNPLAWIAGRRMSVERERACDDRTLERGVRASDYAEHLVVVARSLSAAPWTTAAVSMAGRTQLEKRIRAILAVGLRRDPVPARQACALVLLALVIVGPLALLRAQTTGSVSGILFDPSRAVIAGAELILEGGAAPVSSRTGPDGTYAFDSVAPGRYVLRVRVPGFVEGVVPGIEVRAGSERRVFPQLAMGEITEQVEVVAERAGAIAPNRAPVRVRVGGKVSPARLVSRVNPEFPADAREAGARGAVRITGTIGQDGAMQNLRVMHTPHPGLGTAALEAVSKWRFEPAKLNGEPVAISTGVTVNFEYEGEKQ